MRESWDAADAAAGGEPPPEVPGSRPGGPVVFLALFLLAFGGTLLLRMLAGAADVASVAPVRVLDPHEILSPVVRGELEGRLADLHREHPVRIRLLVLRQLPGATPGARADELLNEDRRRLGEGEGLGVVLVVARPPATALRFGAGLEALIPEALRERVRARIGRALREGRLELGVQLGLDVLLRALRSALASRDRRGEPWSPAGATRAGRGRLLLVAGLALVLAALMAAPTRALVRGLVAGPREDEAGRVPPFAHGSTVGGLGGSIPAGRRERPGW